MATGAPFTLMDLARRTDPDGNASDIAELLSQANEIYDDMVWKEGNLDTGHMFTVRNGLPAGTWRYLNQGTPMSKSTTAQGRINCGELTGLSVIDERILEKSANPAKARYEEDNAFVEGMSQTQAYTAIYGNSANILAEYTGFSPYFNTLETATAASAANTFNGGGVGSNNASIWLIGWSPRSAYMVYPKGSKAGLQVRPLNSTEVAYDSTGNLYPAKLTYFTQMAGLCIEDWRWVNRLCNLDVTSAGLGGTTPFDIFANGMSKMLLRMPKMGRSVSGVTQTDAKSEAGLVVRPAFYTNRTVRGFMDIQAIRDKNVLIGMHEYAGIPVETYRTIPIRIMDVQLSTEAAVT
jgi:hypothetical protein